MLGDEAVRDAGHVLHVRQDAAAVVQDLQVGARLARQVRLEQSDRRRGQARRVDPDQRRHRQGIYWNLIGYIQDTETRKPQHISPKRKYNIEVGTQHEHLADHAIYII